MRTCILILFVCTVLFAQEQSSSEKSFREALAVRYDAAGWPGKGGPAVAGLRPEHFIGRDEEALVFDYDEWFHVGGERVLMRHFTSKGRTLNVAFAVTRSCNKAHQLFLDHLTRLRTKKPLDPPALPYGEVRMQGIGQVCLSIPEYSLEFVRNNVVVLMSAEAEAVSKLTTLARSIDEAILLRPVADRWPTINRFRFPSKQVKAGSLFPVDFSVSDPRGAKLELKWEPSAGGIIKREGKTFFYAEGQGEQTLNLLIWNQDGLSSAATVEFEVMD